MDIELPAAEAAASAAANVHDAQAAHLQADPAPTCVSARDFDLLAPKVVPSDVRARLPHGGTWTRHGERDWKRRPSSNTMVQSLVGKHSYSATGLRMPKCFHPTSSLFRLSDDLLSTMAGSFAESRGRAAEEIYGELWKQPASRSSDDDGLDDVYEVDFTRHLFTRAALFGFTVEIILVVELRHTYWGAPREVSRYTMRFLSPALPAPQTLLAMRESIHYCDLDKVARACHLRMDRAIREQAGVRRVQLREWQLLTTDNDVAIGVDASLLVQGEVPTHLFADMQAIVVAVAHMGGDVAFDLENIGPGIDRRGIDPNLALAVLVVQTDSGFVAVLEAHPFVTLRAVCEQQCRLLVWGSSDVKWLRGQFGHDVFGAFGASVLDLQGDRFYLRPDASAVGFKDCRRRQIQEGWALARDLDDDRVYVKEVDSDSFFFPPGPQHSLPARAAACIWLQRPVAPVHVRYAVADGVVLFFLLPHVSTAVARRLVPPMPAGAHVPQPPP